MTGTRRGDEPFSRRDLTWSQVGARPRTAILALLATATMAVACTHQSDPPLLSPAAARIAAAGPASATPPASTQQDVLVAMLFPASGPESRWTQGLSRFVWTIRYNYTRACVHAHHIPMPLIAPPMFVRFYAIPDLNYIRAHGFSGQVQDPENHGSGAVSAVVSRVQNDCVTASRQTVQAVQASYATLQTEWLNEVSSLRTDPDVVQAYRALPTCLATHGIRAADEASFFTAFAARKRSVEGKPQAGRIEREFVSSYATCMAPIEAVRVVKRTAMREDFLARHTKDVRGIQATLIPALQQLQRDYGVPITFPVN